MMCSTIGTAAAAVLLFSATAEGMSDSRLRLLGAGGGAAVAIALVVFGLCRRDAGVHWDDNSGLGVSPRFVFERRHAPRLSVRRPVQVVVNGRRCEATLLSVSATGALLRLRGAAGRGLGAEVGHLVHIDDHPVGRLSRIGGRGAYVELAVMFDPGDEAGAKTRELSLTSSA